MSIDPDYISVEKKDCEITDIRRLFDQGLAAGLDPDSSARSCTSIESVADRHAVTTLRSRWLHQRCKTCGHSFRLGDEVLVLQNGEVVHDMPGLRCHGKQIGEICAGSSEYHILFFSGLEAAWPLPDDVSVVRLKPGDPLLAPPPRQTCRVCGHTFRPDDHVVICPCSPHAPRCQAAVHRDLLRQLHCWDEWVRESKGKICLGMS